MNKFIIFSVPRTGSTLLTNSLNTHSQLKVEDEIFHEYYPTMVDWRIKNLGNHYMENYKFDFELMDNVFEKLDGFKILNVNEIFKNENNLDTLINYVNANNLLSIILKRKDVINSLISLSLSEITKIYQNVDFKTFQKDIKITVDIKTFEDRIKKMEYFYKKTNAIKNKIEIYYDKLIQNWDQEINSLLEAIGVEKQEIKMKFGKVINKDYKDYIENYDELLNHFKHTNWAINRITI